MDEGSVETRPEVRRWRGALSLCCAFLALLAACGGDDSSAPASGGVAEIRGTLAYVVDACEETSGGVTKRGTLRVQRGEQPPRDVAGYQAFTPGVSGECITLASARIYSASRGALQRLAVSPDGSRVAFELSDDFSMSIEGALDPEAEGFFVVDADGGGLQRLGPPSREAAYFVNQGTIFESLDFQFSPDGRSLAYVDQGPGPGDVEAPQAFLFDLDAGTRRQLTHLPLPFPAPDVPEGVPAVSLLTFVDEDTLAFISATNPDGVNPAGEVVAFTVQTKGSPVLERLPEVSVAGGRVDPRFQITGKQPTVGIVVLPGEPLGPPAGPLLGIQEIFLRDGSNLLQLTNFHRADTFASQSLAHGGGPVFFTASADPLGANPSNNCQLFSIDRTGGDLRQLTAFSETEASLNGCTIFYPKGYGCTVAFGGEDAVTHSVVFFATCDPFGSNPNGSQLFTVGPDGGGLRQLTDLPGLVIRPGVEISAAGVSSIAFSGR